jgi:hypothetical protein
MTRREVICSQQAHCLSCPLSVLRTGKDCHELSAEEIERIIQEVKNNENTKVYGTFR